MNPQELQNNSEMNNQVYINQLIPNENLSSIQRITITKTESEKQVPQTNTNMNYFKDNNNIESNPNITETKIIGQTIDPQRFSFRDKSNLNIVSLDNNKSNSYKQLIQKIANQLKKPVRPPTQGYFYFALQKGEYSLMIIRKLSSQMRNHKIELNNDIFRIYIQKYKKYKELIKRIAHLLKISMKNPNFYDNIKYQQNINTENNNISQTIIINSSKNNNINNQINTTKNANEIKKNSEKNKQIKKISDNNDLNQKKIKSQILIQNHINKNNKNIQNLNNRNKYNYSNNINHKKINQTNPFFASKEKLSFNSMNSNKINNKLQNPNQYLAYNNQKQISKNNSKSPITQDINKKNKKKKEIKINFKNHQNIINKQEPIKELKESSNKDLKKDIIHEDLRPNINMEINQKNNMTNIVHTIQDNNIQKTHNIINSISNSNNDMNLINNNESNNSIFSATPINSKFVEITNEDNLQMNNNLEKENFLSDKTHRINIISTSILNPEATQSNINNNTDNINTNFNVEQSINNLNLNNHLEENDINPIINNNSENNNSMTNNYNSDSNNNITISTLNKEEDKTYSMSIDSNKDKNKTHKIKLSPFKKSKTSIIQEEKSINSNLESQNININNIQKLNCNTFSENELNVNDSIIYQREISTSVDEVSFLKKFNVFLTKNNILIDNFIPMAININGQKYLKENAFWEKYINYIYINYSVNNIRLSLFSFVHIIEQYFLWCENLNSDIVDEFQSLIIGIIKKIYDNDEINQFCSMNRISNIEELFNKYKLLMNNKKDFNYESNKQIEIKINNKSQNECFCDLCKSDIACVKKMIELNKNKIIEVKIENLFYDGSKNFENKDKNEDESERESNKENSTKRNNKKTYPPKKSRGSSIGNKDIKNQFSNSKIQKISEQEYEFIAKETKKVEYPKKNRKTSASKNKRKSSSNKKEYIEDHKIDSYFNKEEKEEVKINDDEMDLSDKESKYKNKKKRNKSYKEIKNDNNDEKEEKETKKEKKKKKQKSKNKKKEKNQSDSESDEGSEKPKRKKKKIQYPKD